MTAEPAPPQIAIVIPCFNEALTVRKVIEDFSRAVPDAMVYVFDNNSVDGTGEIAREAGARVIVSPIQGKGNVIRHMSRVVDADIYVLVDGDDTYSADAAPAMLERFLGNTEKKLREVAWTHPCFSRPDQRPLRLGQ